MKILVVEDSPEKLGFVLGAIRAGGCTDEDVDVAYDSRQAKLKTEERQYDLMILDLMLPPSPGVPPKTDGGVALLSEIQDRDRFKMPREVVGLTAYDSIREGAMEMFGEFMWSILIYDPTSDLWSTQVTRKVSHLLLAERAETPLGFDCHSCVLTAMPMELEAVLRVPWNWSEFKRANDVTVYWKGQVTARGTSKTVYAAAAPRMGNTATAVLATKMIEAFRPEFIFMTGIAAGMRGRCELGDVIVADPSWDWESGKYSIQDGVSSFAPAPHQLPISSAIRVNIQRLMKQQSQFDGIKQAWPGDCPGTSLKMFIGPVASGGSVLADPSKIGSIEHQNRKLLAIEMESYGLYTAASEARVPQPCSVSLKGVSDFADNEKSDAFQKYAAYTSAEAMRALVEKFL